MFLTQSLCLLLFYLSTSRTADPKADLVDPAVIGTMGILRAIVRSAPTVRRVVVTSSFAAILDEARLEDPNTTFSEKTWNPVTLDDIHKNPATAYRASKKLAEKAAWEFVQDPSNGAKFDLATVNPPMVFGPVVHYLASVDSINTSNERLVDLLRGKWKTGIPPTGAAIIWVDVRDVAKAHVQAGLEVPEAAGKRLFTYSSTFCNHELFEIVKKNFPEYVADYPAELKGGEYPTPDKVYKHDNSTTTELLGMKWITLEQSIVDTIKSLKAHGA